MASKTRNHADSGHESEVANAQNVTADLGRQQLAGMAEATAVMLRATESLQQVQQHLIHRAALSQQHAADKLRKVSNPADLFAVQSELMLAGFTEMAQYLQEILTTTAKIQGDIVRPASGPQGSVPNPAESMFKVWQSMLAVPMNGSSAGHAQ